jgi:hypothetical protein
VDTDFLLYSHVVLVVRRTGGGWVGEGERERERESSGVSSYKDMNPVITSHVNAATLGVRAPMLAF